MPSTSSQSTEAGLPVRFLSPLRYPGGKSKLARRLATAFPYFLNYREPFLGGGSVFFAAKARREASIWELSDINTELTNFWQQVRDNPTDLVGEIQLLRSRFPDGRELFQNVRNPGTQGPSAAARYFVRNRISFSGNQASGGFSELSFRQRLTDSVVDRISTASKLLQEVEITNHDYGSALTREGDDVFLFLDPPYLSAKKSRLYGDKGTLHKEFDHKRFANLALASPHPWLITYDDCEEVRDLFAGADGVAIQSFSNHYASANSGLKPAGPKIGQEVLISNFGISSSWV